MGNPLGVGRPRAAPHAAGHRCAGCRLIRARLRLGLTQAQLAARLDVGARSVVRWEQGAPPRAVLELAERLAADDVVMWWR